MKVAYFNYHHNIQGSSIGPAAQIAAVTNGLEKRGHVVETFYRNLTDQSDQTSVKAKLKKINWLRYWVHGPKKMLKNIPNRLKEIKLIKESNPDVVLNIHSYFNDSVLKAAKSCNVPYVLFIEAPMVYENQLFWTRHYAYPFFGRRYEALNVRGADQIICITEILKGYLMRYGVPATKIHVVSNGVDHNAIKPLEPDHDLVAKYDLTDKTIIGFVGSFNFFDYSSEFLQSLQVICNKHKDVYFLMVGQGNRIRDEFRMHLESYGINDRFIFAGKVDHEKIPTYYSLMDIAIAPYRGDYLFYGSSMKMLEYLSAGLPTLITGLGQIREVITDGYNGFLYDWKDSDAIISKLDSLITNKDLRREIGVNARKTIVDAWTWDHQVAKIERVLQTAKIK